MTKEDKNEFIKKISRQLTITKNIALLHSSHEDLKKLKDQLRHIDNVIENLENSLKKDSLNTIKSSLIKGTYSSSISSKEELLRLSIKERMQLEISIKKIKEYIEDLKMDSDVSPIYQNFLKTPPNQKNNLLSTRILILLNRENLTPKEIVNYLSENKEILIDPEEAVPSSDSIGKRIRNFNMKYNLDLSKVEG